MTELGACPVCGRPTKLSRAGRIKPHHPRIGQNYAVCPGAGRAPRGA